MPDTDMKSPTASPPADPLAALESLKRKAPEGAAAAEAPVANAEKESADAAAAEPAAKAQKVAEPAAAAAAATEPAVRQVTSLSAATASNEAPSGAKLSYREEQLLMMGIKGPPRNFTNADKKDWSKKERSMFSSQCSMHGPAHGRSKHPPASLLFSFSRFPLF